MSAMRGELQLAAGIRRVKAASHVRRGLGMRNAHAYSEPPQRGTGHDSSCGGNISGLILRRLLERRRRANFRMVTPIPNAPGLEVGK
jgi:hypothetical protein